MQVMRVGVGGRFDREGKIVLLRLKLHELERGSVGKINIWIELCGLNKRKKKDQCVTFTTKRLLYIFMNIFSNLTKNIITCLQD